MEIVTKQFEMNQLGKCVENQFLIDEDFNIPDSKQDVKRVLLGEGSLRIQETKMIENYMRVSGKVNFQVLYETENLEPMYACVEGKIPFEEMIYLDEEALGKCEIRKQEVDLKVSVIHSRKLRIKAIVDLQLQSEKCVQEEIPIDVKCDEKIYKKQENVELLKLHTSKRDMFRIKEEFELQGTKESIGMILWTDISNRKLETKLADEELQISGELFVFCFYESPEGKLDWVEQTVPYKGKIPCHKVNESMFHHVQTNLEEVHVDVRLDEDGETRVLGVEGTMNCAIAIYEEEKVEVLRDLYSLSEDCILETKEVACEQMVLQNNSKCKIMERISVPELQQDVLQICHSSGRVLLEEMEPQDDGVFVAGILYVSVLYVKSDDEMPFDVWNGMVPFSHLVECSKGCNTLKYDITTLLEQLNISLQGGNEIEVKAILAFRGFFRKEEMIEKIDKITTGKLAAELLENSPSVVGYIVKEGDEIWDLAKKYKTSETMIRDINELGERNLQTGERLLIFKENMSIL